MSTQQAKPGQLIIVGSGLSSASQLTLQAVEHIEKADIVFYASLDPFSEAFIQKKNPNHFDLSVFYDEEKPRIETYVQIAEVMLKRLRLGKYVVGVFYGHPGVCVYPTHRAIALARAEGYTAVMLPGISTHDCLYAELGVNPALMGCLTYEATDMLVHNRPVITSSHLVLLQVGVVAVVDCKFKPGSDAFQVLLDYLEAQYGPDHSIVHYIGSIYPQVPPVVQTFSIASLRDAQNAAQINTLSTFYIPPKTILAPNAATRERLGATGVDRGMYAGAPWPGFSGPLQSPYSEQDNQTVADMDSHVNSPNYVPLSASAAMRETMIKIALDSKTLHDFSTNPEAFADSISDLTPAEKAALRGGKISDIIGVTKGSAGSASAGSACHQPSCFQPSCFQTSCLQASCFQPSCFQPSCFQPSCFQPACFQPSCFQPSCLQPTGLQGAGLHQPSTSSNTTGDS